MGHAIRAIIAQRKVLEPLAEGWVHAQVILLPQEMAMIFAVDELIDDIIELVDFPGNSLFPEFSHLVPSLDSILKQWSMSGPVAYIETEYFGGTGTQAAILYERDQVRLGPLKQETLRTGEQVGEDAINAVFRAMGVRRERAHDEFDALGLGKYRRMDP